MAAGHILRMTQGRPFVQLKLAVSQDGLIARGDGAPRWVTGPEARALGHLMRARTDAILVGRGTVSDDDPELTCRLPGLAGASPRRIVLDARFRTSPSAKLVGAAAEVPVTIIGGTEATPPRYPTGVTIKRAPRNETWRLDLSAVLEGLHEDGITRLLVEGGPTVARSFLDAGLIDEAVVFRGTEPLGPAGVQPILDRGIETFDDVRDVEAGGRARRRPRPRMPLSCPRKIAPGEHRMTQRFRYYLRVRYQDCDAQHVVFNSRYSEYADLTSVEFLRAALPRPTDVFDGSFEVQTVRQVIEWKSPARLDNVLEVTAWVSRIGTTSFALSCEIRRAGESDVLVTTETTYVNVDPKTFAKQAIEPRMRAALEAGAAGRQIDHAGYLR